LVSRRARLSLSGGENLRDLSAEALAHQAQPVPTDPRLVVGAERSRLEHAFLEWLEVGGFPEAQDLDAASRRQLLRDYVDVAILRDVVERHGVTNVVALRWLVRHLLAAAGNLFSVEKFYRTLKSQGLAVSKDTLHQLLGYLEDCFLVRTVWIEADSERQRMVNPRKAYPVDPGLIPLFDRTGRANVGHALETAVLVELARRRCEVTYVRTPEGHEVDFLARAPDGSEHLIQVCADASDPQVATREVRALREAGRRWPRARKWLLTLTWDRTPPDPPKDVACLPAYQWMLSNEITGVVPTRARISCAQFGC
jgi:predicted AAA+ superfamily ATPase